MRWACRRPSHIFTWHRWFAWYPVVVDDQWTWLETVEQRWDYNDYYSWWKYRHAN